MFRLCLLILCIMIGKLIQAVNSTPFLLHLLSCLNDKA